MHTLKGQKDGESLSEEHLKCSVTVLAWLNRQQRFIAVVSNLVKSEALWELVVSVVFKSPPWNQRQLDYRLLDKECGRM